MLYFDALLYMALAWYLNQIVPQQYGVRKPWNFLWAKRDDNEIIQEERESQEPFEFDYNTKLEDADAKAERNYVYNIDPADYPKFPLIVKDVRKVYPAFGGRREKVATKNFSLRVKAGEVLGLLGPNGAGKTTLISILTGVYPPTRGNAWVSGFDIKHSLEAVQRQVGYCP
mmetsp:Transcript_5689/g.9774  ORF Transcript_5689/g.9774 Transcript_5689/m.9774 type:complete len:171 (+) Transcript_5689:1715-2227(+)